MRRTPDAPVRATARSALKPLTPGELADRLAALPVVIEGHSVETGSVAIVGYYGGGPRPTGEVSLLGSGHVGRGENVDWTTEDQTLFAEACDALVPLLGAHGRATIGGLRGALLDRGASPHHRAAIEAAAIELALRQESTDLYRLAGRARRQVRHCWSIGREIVERDGPLSAVARLLQDEPEARVKIDSPPAGWPEPTWRHLAETGRIVVVDFKREGAAAQVALAHRHLPEAWLEDPPLAAWTPRRCDAPPWLERVALDGYVGTTADLDDPPIPPAAVNVKAPRMGGPLEALRCLDRCLRRNWHAYVGGMFETGAGRRQARDLASLFTADAWNDLAPLRRISA